MKSIDKVIDSFMTGDYFIVFLVLTLVVLLVLVLALIKSREEYNELLNYELNRNKKQEESIKNEALPSETNVYDGLESFLAKDKDDVIDETKPLNEQIELLNDKTYDKTLEYENNEEDTAVISAEELEKRTKERLDALGNNDNQIAIAKYEEEQEKKAIISYEQLLKNASNITLSYKEEEKKDKGAPKINKIEVEQKEVTGAEIYLKEDEFLKVLKNFRANLE